MKTWHEWLLAGLLALAIVFFLILLPWLNGMSHAYAASSPDLAHMRLPVLLLSMAAVLAVIAALALGLWLVIRSGRGTIFDRVTLRALAVMGHCFLAACLLLAAIVGYAYWHLQHEIGLVGGYLMILLAAFFLGANILYFIRNLFAKAVEYKEENELTV